jgi:addiction module HigA family antidote
MARDKRLRPIHPGEILADEIQERGLSVVALARALRVSPSRIAAVTNGLGGISADTALRLARYFGTSPQMWMNLQAAYDLEVAERESGGRIEREVPRAS